MSERKDEVPAPNPDGPGGKTQLSDEALESVAGGVRAPGGCTPPITIDPPIIGEPEPIICPYPADGDTA